MLRQIYTSSKTLTTTGHLSFITSWGAMVMVAGVPLSSYKVFLDGSQVYLGKAFGGLPLNRVGGRLAYYSYWDNYTIFAADDITCQLHTDRVLNPLWKPNFISWGDFVDDENNILIHALSNGSIRYYQLDTGTEIATQDLLTYWPNVICWAGPHKILVLHFSTGQLALVNYITREVLLESTISPCLRAAFNATHNVLIAVDSAKKLNIYALEILPATLSSPEFVPTAPHTHRLMGSPVRVRLTGDAGEVCPDYWIEWSLLGAPPKGELLKTFSKTGADGYAENFWFGPYGAGETGSETIKARVMV